MHLRSFPMILAESITNQSRTLIEGGGQETQPSLAGRRLGLRPWAGVFLYDWEPRKRPDFPSRVTESFFGIL